MCFIHFCEHFVHKLITILHSYLFQERSRTHFRTSTKVLFSKRSAWHYWFLVCLNSFCFLPHLREITRYKFFLLPQARTFNETPINPRKCIHILTKILYVLNQVSEFDGEFYMIVQLNAPIMNWLRLKHSLKIFIISR